MLIGDMNICVANKKIITYVSGNNGEWTVNNNVKKIDFHKYNN